MQLNAQHGQLYAGDNLLVVIYNAGDCDTIPWPKPNNDLYWTPENWKEALTSALYDAREMGLIPDTNSVTLPDGSTFDF